MTFPEKKPAERKPCHQVNKNNKKCVEQKKGDNKTSVNISMHVLSKT